MPVERDAPSFQIADASRNASFAIAFDMPCVMWTAVVSDDGTGAAGSHVNVEINASHIMDSETFRITFWFRVRTRTLFSRSRTVFAYMSARGAAGAFIDAPAPLRP